MINANNNFTKTYNRPPAATTFCPYRICPIGAHVDHQHGKVTGLAINKGIHIAYSPKQNGIVEVRSLNFAKRAQFHVAKVPETRQNDWADYLRGATAVLGERYPLEIGLCGVIEGELPIGGLSSSASVIIAFLTALCTVNNIHISEREMVVVAQEAENKYVGVNCGTLDQSCEIFSRKDHLLYLDTLDGTYELIQKPGHMKPYGIAIFFCGVERTLVGSKYNMRQDECKSAAYAMMAYEGMEYGKFNEAHLRAVTNDVYHKHKSKLPMPWRNRAEHFYAEQERVCKGVAAWRAGDIEAYGKLSFESGASSIENYETGSDELIKLYEIMRSTDGIYGGRFSGAGFRGCCMALIDPSYEDSIIKHVTASYTQIFPALKDKFTVHICHSADGVVLP